MVIIHMIHIVLIKTCLLYIALVIGYNVFKLGLHIIPTNTGLIICGAWCKMKIQALQSKLLISRQRQQSIIPTVALLNYTYDSTRNTSMNSPCGLQFILRGVTRTCHIHTKSSIIIISMADIYWMLNLKDSCSWKKNYDKPKEGIKKQRHYFANKGPSSQSYGFSSSHKQMWKLDHKESWVLMNRCFWTVVLEKTLESSLDSKGIKSVSPKGNQPWIFIRRTEASNTEAPILWPPDLKSQLIKKDPDAGKDRRQEEKGTTEYDMFGYHHQINGHGSEQAPEDGEGQGSLVCGHPWGRKKSDRTEKRSNNMCSYYYKM